MLMCLMAHLVSKASSIITYNSSSLESTAFQVVFIACVLLSLAIFNPKCHSTHLPYHSIALQ